MSIKEISESIRKYAEVVGNVPSGSELVEICDFGDAYGFLFDIGDKFANVYWCVNKKTYEPSTFIPSQDIKRYIKRAVLSMEG